MKTRCLTLTLICFLLVVFCFPSPVSAERGTPESLEFASGARLDLNGAYLEQALRLAAQLHLDWIAVDYDWAAAAPERSGLQVSSQFNLALRLADKLGLSVLVSIKNPPAWALTTQGPDPLASADLISSLAGSYPGMRAVELYPQANTRSGWGAAPNPAAYAALYQTAETRLTSENRKIYLVAGGLSNQLSLSEDINDLEFLQGLYTAGLRPAILSLQLGNLTGTPLDEPSAASLRHYEQVRTVMTTNQQTTGLLWITSFAHPAALTTPETQSGWLEQATLQMRSQLYLGAVFYQTLNPRPEAGNESFSLVTPLGALQPFVQVLGKWMNQPLIGQLPKLQAITKKMESNLLFARFLNQP